MQSLEIVTHSWRYARCLCYQLTSVKKYGQGCLVSLFYCPEEDPKTASVVDFFKDKINLQPWALPREMLCARAIGRNMAARATKADLVWFTDCDYLLGEGSVEAMTQEREGVLWHPPYIMATEQPVGDKLIFAVKPPELVSAEDEFFNVRYRLRTAVGGFQLARGDVVREKGYIPHSARHQKPRKEWRRTYCDRVFRHSLGTGGIKVEIQGIKRIRHTERGRFKRGLEL